MTLCVCVYMWVYLHVYVYSCVCVCNVWNKLPAFLKATKDERLHIVLVNNFIFVCIST